MKNYILLQNLLPTSIKIRNSGVIANERYPSKFKSDLLRTITKLVSYSYEHVRLTISNRETIQKDKNIFIFVKKNVLIDRWMTP